jgi:hypothetical protein
VARRVYGHFHPDAAARDTLRGAAPPKPAARDTVPAAADGTAPKT